jgi:hypothetical protein
MDTLWALVILLVIVLLIVYYGYRIRMPVEVGKVAKYTTLSTVTVSLNGKRSFSEMCRLSIYDDSIVIMRLPRYSRHSFEARDYDTGMASRRSHLPFIRAIFNDNIYRFAFRPTLSNIISMTVDRNKGIAYVEYLENSEEKYTIAISKLLNMSQSHKKLIDLLESFKSL